MHILFLTDNFPPEVNAPASRTFEHGREWVKAGHRVTVITCVPNFPSGRVFPGYRNRLWQREWMEGIRVVRVWTYMTANEGLVRRTLDYLSFMLAAIPASLFIRKVDVVVGTSPQFFTACAAYVVSCLKRCPFIFELRDLWPASIAAVGAMRDGWVLRALERIELWLYHKASRVVSVTQAFKRVLVARGVDAAKIVVVTNGADLARFSPREKDADLVQELDLAGVFVCGYIGTLGMAHALDTLVDAARRLQDEGVVFLFVGAGAERARLEGLACRERISNVRFVGPVSKEQIPRYWSVLDVSVIHLKRTAVFQTVIPSKLFESLGMGIPILLGVEGEAADFVREKMVGLLFQPQNVEALCEVVRGVRRNPDLHRTLRQRCLAAASCYSRHALAMRMLRCLEDCAEPNRYA